MNNQKTIILIDGHALAYRMFFALERTGMKTSYKQPTWAIYGFLKAIFDLLNKVKPDALAVSFDVSKETFRLKEYPLYKANREAMPDTLREQMELIMEGVRALDIPIYTKKGFEADDVIGTISKKADDLGHRTYILTGDQDSFQLVDDGIVTVLIPSKGELVEYDTDKVFTKLGVYPNQVVDYKALRGDTSDNIPGVKGIGEKTAAKLLEEFQTLENIYENLDKIKSESLKSKLVTDKEMAFKSQFLAQIKRDVEIDFDFTDTHLSKPDVKAFQDYLTKLEFYSLLKQVPKIMQSFGEKVEEIVIFQPVAAPVVSEPRRDVGLQQSLFSCDEPEKNYDNIEKKIISTEEEFLELVETLKTAKIFSLDTETTGINMFGTKIVGISVGYTHGISVSDDKLIVNQDCKTKSAYIPIGHETGVNLDEILVMSSLKPILESEEYKKILQNAKFEMHMFKNYDIALNGVIFDTMIANYVKDPSLKHGLKAQALAYLKLQMTEIEELIGKGKSSITMNKVDVAQAGDYACLDAYATMELAKFHQKSFDEKQINLFYNIEMPLIKVLFDMEREGIALDTGYLADLSAEIEVKIEILEKNIYQEAGMTFNINSPKQVGDVLFGHMQIQPKGKNKTKTGFSTSADVLEELAKDYPIAKMLLEQRHLAKLKSTYIDALPKLINPEDKRIHTSFNQTITTTGRLSSSNPNLQNIPIRTEIGARIRRAFIPENPGQEYILSADYSQVELRLMAHLSKDNFLIEDFNNDIDIHTATASKVFDLPIEEVTSEMRRRAKAVNFGIIYGQSSYGLADSLGITPQEARGFINRYFETYPEIKKFMDETKIFAYQHGYVETMFGRRRYFDDIRSSNRNIREFAERAAINSPLQGSAADLIKIAMIKLSDELKAKKYASKVVLQVHDELILEVPKHELEEIKELVTKCMELDQPLDVPLVVDIEVGTSWMESDI